MGKKKAFSPTQEVQKNTQQTTSLDVRLVANLDDEVYYLRPQIDYFIADNGSEKLRIIVDKERIVKGTVCNINSDNTRVFMRIDRADGYTEEFKEMVQFIQSPEVEQLQEFFFATLAEAENAVDRLNDSQHGWDANNWAEECRQFLNVSYPYKLCFPVEAGKIIHQADWGKSHFLNTLVKEVWANINSDPSKTRIHYRGENTYTEISKRKFEDEYKIVKAKKKR